MGKQNIQDGGFCCRAWVALVKILGKSPWSIFSFYCKTLDRLWKKGSWRERLKFFTENYLRNVFVKEDDRGLCFVKTLCFRSQRKSEAPHVVNFELKLLPKQWPKLDNILSRWCQTLFIQLRINMTPIINKADVEDILSVLCKRPWSPGNTCGPSATLPTTHWLLFHNWKKINILSRLRCVCYMQVLYASLLKIF